VKGVRAKLPGLLSSLPPGVTITPLNDASTFVSASIEDVVQEMVTAAVLAGIAVLLFVDSWRSTLIVAASIPLSILSSVIALSAGDSIGNYNAAGQVGADTDDSRWRANHRGSPSSFLLPQVVDERLRRSEIGRVESFAELLINRHNLGERFTSPTLFALQLAKAHCSAQFQ